jgi:hypothetical protein
VLESDPGEEAQVEFGPGALTRYTNGKYRRPYLFVMSLKYSGKAFQVMGVVACMSCWMTSNKVSPAAHTVSFSPRKLIPP